MPGQARIITPNTTDARPCRPSTHRIFVICVRACFGARSSNGSISYLPFGLTFAPRNLHGVDARPLPPPRSVRPAACSRVSRFRRECSGSDGKPRRRQAMRHPSSALSETRPRDARGRGGSSSLRGRSRRRFCVNRLREVQDLTRELEQLFVLAVFFLDGLPLLVGDYLTLRVRPVLADHHEGREKDS